MADFDLSLAITADADDADKEVRQLKKELQDLKKQVDDLKAAEGGAVAPKKKLTQETEKLTSATRAQATASRGLGVQINDVATQLSLGAKPMQVFAAQAGQIGFAMTGMGGKLAQVGGFLAGGWGAALLIATSLLSAFATKLYDTEEATKSLTEAQKLHKLTLEELTEAIRKESEELGKNTTSSREAEHQALVAAAAKREEVLQRRQHILALIEEQKQLLGVQMASKVQGVGGAEAQGQLQAQTSARVAELQRDLTRAEDLLAKAERNVRTATVPIVQRAADARTDPAKRIQEDYQKRVDDINKSYEDGVISLQTFNREIGEANRKRDAETKQLQEQNRSRSGGLPKVQSSEVADLFKSVFGSGTPTSGIRSAARNRAVGGAANSYHLSGQAVDFVPSGGMARVPANWKDLIRQAAAESGIKLLELLGPGDPKHSDHLHAAFARGRLGPDQVAAAEARQQREAERRQRAADALASFGSGAADRLSGLGARFSMEPSRAVAVKEALADVDRVLAEIEKRKPPNFEALLAQGAQVKQTIADSLQKPYQDFIRDQQTSLEQERLINDGREAEAEVLRTVAQLQEQVGELLPEQLVAVRAIVNARRAEALEAAKARQQQQKYLNAVGETRDAFRAIFDFSGQGLRDLPGRLAKMAEQLVGDFLFDKVFGSFFDDAADQVKGVMRPVAVGADELARIIADANRAIASMAQAAQGASDKLSGVDPLAPLSDGQGGTGGGDGGDVVVTGSRIATKAVRDPGAFLGDILEKLAKGILGEQMAKKIGAIVGQALQGAAIGNMAAGAIFGSKQGTGSKIGASIGGALGQIAGNAIGKSVGGALGSAFGPIGSALGGIAGSLLGGLFGGKPKVPTGSITINSAYGAGSYSGSSQLKGGLTSAGTSIQDTLLSIAEQLGGALGQFNVSLGKDKNDDWVVDVLGLGRLKSGDSNTPEFKSQEEAMAFAIMDAIKDGAVTGLSAAVQKALKSSTDVTRALREAMKVSELEILISGVGGAMEKSFRDFELQAKERVRIAKTYGLDLVKVEELNAKEREKLLKDVLDQRLGSLRQLLTDLTSGNLFEGTPTERRQILLGQISTTKASAIAGDEGAADRLAELERQLVETTREAFGTAGPEYAADRAQAQADAEAIIALETQRAQEAQERAIASLNAQNQTNDLLNETNNILTEMLGYYRRSGNSTATATSIPYDTTRQTTNVLGIG